MTIICATDFSASADSAARIGARFARLWGDDILLAHVIQPMGALYPPELGVSAAGWDAALRTGLESTLRERADDLAKLGVSVETLFVLGRPDEAIVRLATERRARLITLGSHGRRGAARLFLGSVAERTALTAPCPVLVTQAEAAGFDDWAAGRRSLRVLVGVDATEASDAAAAWVGGVRTAHPVDVTLFHAYWPPREHARLGLPEPLVFESDPVVTAVLVPSFSSFSSSRLPATASRLPEVVTSTSCSFTPGRSA